VNEEDVTVAIKIGYAGLTETRYTNESLFAFNPGPRMVYRDPRRRHRRKPRSVNNNEALSRDKSRGVLASLALTFTLLVGRDHCSGYSSDYLFR
jgi:hypothetical protein